MHIGIPPKQDVLLSHYDEVIDFSSGLDSRFGFARTTERWHRDSSGLLVNKPIDVVRLEHNAQGIKQGMLFENQRSQYAKQSENLDDVAHWANNWAGGTTLTPNAGTDPYGNNALFLCATISATGGGNNSGQMLMPVNTPTRCSCYVQKGTSSRFAIRIWDQTGSTSVALVEYGWANDTPFVILDHQGTASDFTVDEWLPGLFRISFLVTTHATNSDHRYVMHPSFNDVIGSSTYFFGPNFTPNPELATYIKAGTGTAAAAAEKDVIMSGTDFTDLIDVTGSTVVCACRRPSQNATGAYPSVFQLDNGIDDDRIGFFLSGASFNLNATILVATVTQIGFTGQPMKFDNMLNKIGMSFEANNVKFSVNGGVAEVDTTVALPPMTRLVMGAYANAVCSWQGSVDFLAVKRSPVSAEVLQEMTRVY